MLKPELQDGEQYADSIENLVEAGQLVAKDISRMGVRKSVSSPSGTFGNNGPW